ncbi:MAG: type II secretion system protein [Lachnospiraceae bacterium]|nr:type II secretion system protein [Lachnospiraceae bacterium]
MKWRGSNKGFSLVELIIVIAIMAVLAGVLAPALLRYVEEARMRTDEEKAADLDDAVTVAAGELGVHDEILSLTLPAELKFYPGTGFVDTEGKIPTLKQHVEEIMSPQKMYFKSHTYDSPTSYYKVVVDIDGVEVTIEK